MKNFVLSLLGCVVFLIFQSPLKAQIYWSDSTDLYVAGDNSNFISQQGIFVLGINPGGADTTIGTAAFLNVGGFVNAEGLAVTGGVSSTQNGVTFIGAFDNVQQPTFGDGEFSNAAIGNLLSTATWNHAYSPANPDTVTFFGLTPGDTYEIQILVNDARGGSNAGVRDEAWQVAFTNGNNELVATTAQLTNRSYDTDGDPRLAGDFVTGTFIAAADGIQTFSMSGTRGNNLPADQFIVGESIDIAGDTSSGQTQINALQLRNISAVSPLLGDCNLNGKVDFLDIAPFISILSNGGFLAQADCDGNGVVNFLDIAPFIAILSGPPVTTVNSIAELQQYAVQNNVDVKMAPGTYTITGADVLAGLRQESNVDGAIRYNVFQFSGNGSTYDMTDVVLEVDSSVWTTEYGNDGVFHIHIMGNNNVIKNLTMLDVGSVHDAPRDDCVNVVMDGTNNRIEGFHVSSQGSSPYGYGDVFGKGSGSVLPLRKHSTCLVRGESNHVKDCTFIHRTFGHCIFMQAASNPLIEGCYIEGEMRTTDDILAEEGTGSAADNVDFMTTWGYRLPAGYIVSTGEEGIRAYNGGTTIIDGVVSEGGTVNPTVIDCTIKYMRGGVTLPHASGTIYASNCTAIGCEQGFEIGNGTADNCKADVSNGHAFKSTYDNDDWDLNIEILPATDPYYNGQKCIAFIGMDNSKLTLTGGDPNLPADYRIQIGGMHDGVRFQNGSLTNQSTHNGLNNTVTNATPHPIVIASGSNNNSGSSNGTVVDNGNGNSID